MQSQIVDISKVRKELQVTVSQDELTPHFEQAYKKFQQKATMPGFRPGKVPLSMVIKMHGIAIQYQEIEKIAQKFFQQAFIENKLEPIARPVMKDIDFNPGQPLKFTVAYDVKPEIKLPDFKKLNLQQIDSTLNPDHVEKEIEYLCQVSGTFNHDVDDTAQATDYLMLEIEELDGDGNPSGHKLNPKFFSERSEEFSAADKKKLVGLKKGDSVKLTLIDKDKEKAVQATLLSISRHTPAEFTDAFVNEYTKGQLTTTADFRADLEKRISARLEQQKESSLIDSMMDELISNSTLEVPETLVDAYLDSFVHDKAHESEDHKLPADFDEEQFRKENTTLAERSASWYLIKQEIIDKEKLEVTDEDFENHLKTIAEKQGFPVESLRRAYSKPENRENINNQIMTQKVVSLITEKSKVKTVRPEDFKLKITA